MSKIKFSYARSPYNDGHYMITTICKTGNVIYRKDVAIADILKMDVSSYRDYMYKLFHAHYMRGSNISTTVMHFKTPADVQAAVDWIESRMIMNKLRG